MCVRACVRACVRMCVLAAQQELAKRRVQMDQKLISSSTEVFEFKCSLSLSLPLDFTTPFPKSKNPMVTFSSNCHC